MKYKYFEYNLKLHMKKYDFFFEPEYTNSVNKAMCLNNIYTALANKEKKNDKELATLVMKSTPAPWEYNILSGFSNMDVNGLCSVDPNVSLKAYHLQRDADDTAAAKFLKIL